MKIKEMELQLAIKRAETAKFELLYKIERSKEEIARLEDHAKLQDEVINKLKTDIKKMEK